jgi:hypothetical protein
MKSGSFLDGDMGKLILTPTPPKCIIFMFKIQKFFSGERTPLPVPHPVGAFGASILAPSVLDGILRKILGTGLVI